MIKEVGFVDIQVSRPFDTFGEARGRKERAAVRGLRLHFHGAQARLSGPQGRGSDWLDEKLNR